MTYYHGFSYYSTLNNVSELFLGSFFACIYTKNFRANFNRQGAMLISAILAMTIWLYPNLCEDREFFGQMVPTLFSVALVMLAVVVPGSFDFPILNKIFNFLGKRSYSFYVVQLLLANAVVWYTNSIYFPKESLSEYDFYRYQLLIFIVSLLIVTELVFRFIERPFRKIGQM
jgi:peptidoglycan/LPS O-acetylase OafA/YrhL